MHNLGLEKISKNEKDSRRVTLLTCRATHHRYRGMPFSIVAWPFLFNSQSLTAEPNYTDAFTKQYTGTYQGKSDVETMITEEISRKELALSDTTRLKTLDIAELALYDELKEKQMCLLGSQSELRLVRRANIALHGQKIRLQEAQETTEAVQKSLEEELQRALKDNAALRANQDKTQDMIRRLQDFRAKVKQQDRLKEKETFLLASQAELQLMRRHIIRLNMALRAERVRLQQAQEITKAPQESQVEELRKALKDTAALRANQERNRDTIKRLQDIRAKESQDDQKDATTDSRKATGKRVGFSTPTMEAYKELAKQNTGQRKQAVTSKNVDQEEPGASAKSAHYINFQPPNRPRQQLRSSPTTTTIAELRIIIQSIFSSRQQDMQHLQRYYCTSTLQPLCHGEIVQIRRKYIENQAREALKINMLNRSTRNRLCSRLTAFGGKLFWCGWCQASDTNEA